MTTAFAPDGSEPMGRRINRTKLRSSDVNIHEFYKLDLVEQFLVGYEGFVALQLSDRLLGDAVAIVRQLQKQPAACNCMFVIVGDSTYGEGDVDEISAQHIDCKKMIFFGNFNTKTTTTMDTLFIRVDTFDEKTIEESINKIVNSAPGEEHCVLCENQILLDKLNIEIPKIKLDLNDDLKNEFSTKNVLFLGEAADPKIVAWSMQNQPGQLSVISKLDGTVTNNPINTGRLLMQRFYLIERAKDAERVGLVLGSNGGHQLSVNCLEKLRDLAHKSGKTPYTIVVGEPTPQKLANFPEMDIFVLVGSPEVSILPAKGFYKPVIHPWEFIMAASGREWDGSYCVNWAKTVQEDIKVNLKEHDISLISGKVRTVNLSGSELSGNSGSTSLMLKGPSEIATMACHSIRENREFFGLEQDSKESATIIKEGNMGIAQGYSKEL